MAKTNFFRDLLSRSVDKDRDLVFSVMQATGTHLQTMGMVNDLKKVEI